MAPKLLPHQWVSASTVDLSAQQANLARLRGSIRLEQVKIDVLEVYCKRCRRPWDEVFDEPCHKEAEVLNGGPLGIRRKRDHSTHNCELLKCPPEARGSTQAS
uniref:hypothetical protein n=1 Tax=Nonomuraea sp. CA-251285 TaxID=3240002 RepID=UPI003F49AECB